MMLASVCFELLAWREPVGWADAGRAQREDDEVCAALLNEMHSPCGDWSVCVCVCVCVCVGSGTHIVLKYVRPRRSVISLLIPEGELSLRDVQ